MKLAAILFLTMTSLHAFALDSSLNDLTGSYVGAAHFCVNLTTGDQKSSDVSHLKLSLSARSVNKDGFISYTTSFVEGNGENKGWITVSSDLQTFKNGNNARVAVFASTTEGTFNNWVIGQGPDDGTLAIVEEMTPDRFGIFQSPPCALGERSILILKAE